MRIREQLLLKLSTYSEGPLQESSVFDGTLQEMVLISKKIGHGLWRKPGEEALQRLSILTDGRTGLLRYRADAEEGLIEKLDGSISKETVKKIFAAVSQNFRSKIKGETVLDVGEWILLLTNTEGKKFKITGPLCRVPAWKTGRLSDLIRSGLGREDLWAFDGNPDLVNRVEVTYYRSKENEPAGKQKAHAVKTGFGDVRETLVIDRDSETVEYVRKIGTGYQAVNRYYVRKKIRDFLDILDSNFLTEMIEEPPDAIEDRRTIPEYWIRVFTKKGRTHRTEGCFDKNGLPAYWPDFIQQVSGLMAVCGSGEMFDRRIYQKTGRRKSDLTFCNVVFESGGRTYCYLADSDDYREGDFVIVPAGPDNHETVACIVSIEYCSPQKPPFPLEKTKHILRKCEEELLEEILDD